MRWSKCSKDSTMGDSLVWLIKIEAPRLAELVMRSKNRIKIDQTISQVKQKYKGIKLLLD